MYVPPRHAGYLRNLENVAPALVLGLCHAVLFMSPRSAVILFEGDSFRRSS